METRARPSRSGHRKTRGAAAALAVMLTAAGCSNDDGKSSSSDAAVERSVAATGSVPTSTTSSTGMSTGVAASTSSIAVIAETGVPGLDSPDRFCRAWSEFAGSFQALALASGRGTEPLGAARAEVAAAPLIVEAVVALDAELPAELESERDALTVGLVGPMAARAELARAELESAGAGPDQIETLGEAWLAALTRTGLDDPNISVVVDDDLDDLLDVAAASFENAVPPIADDPSLITGASTPLTFEYLSANCPDQGILGGTDVVARP